jgi:hypothetical protein
MQPPATEPSGRAIGWTSFAGIMMVIQGFWWGIAGLNDEFYVVGREYVFQFDTTTWGWIHMVSGLVILASDLGLFVGAVWARTVSALAGNDIYAETPDYVFQLDLTTWGWVHLVVGGIVFLAGFGITLGQTWARIVGIVLAIGSAIATFAFIPFYPFWALVIIALDVTVIWALVAHGSAGGRTRRALSGDGRAGAPAYPASPDRLREKNSRAVRVFVCCSPVRSTPCSAR